MTRFVYLGCDTEVYVEELAAGGAYLNAANATWELLDGATAIGSGTLAYTAGTNGYYTAAIPSTITAVLTLGRRYWIKIPAGQSGANGTFWVELIAARNPGTT